MSSSVVLVEFSEILEFVVEVVDDDDDDDPDKDVLDGALNLIPGENNPLFGFVLAILYARQVFNLNFYNKLTTIIESYSTEDLLFNVNKKKKKNHSNFYLVVLFFFFSLLLLISPIWCTNREIVISSHLVANLFQFFLNHLMPVTIKNDIVM